MHPLTLAPRRRVSSASAALPGHLAPTGHPGPAASAPPPLPSHPVCDATWHGAPARTHPRHQSRSPSRRPCQATWLPQATTAQQHLFRLLCQVNQCATQPGTALLQELTLVIRVGVRVAVDERWEWAQALKGGHAPQQNARCVGTARTKRQQNTLLGTLRSFRRVLFLLNVMNGGFSRQRKARQEKSTTRLPARRSCRAPSRRM